jgi:hypothetical protein
MEKITFDFENGEITIERNEKKSVLLSGELKERRQAILEAAGLEEINGEELRADINQLIKDLGIEGLKA